MPANVENAWPNEENGKFFQMEIYEFIIHLVPHSPNGSLSWGGRIFQIIIKRLSAYGQWAALCHY